MTYFRSRFLGIAAAIAALTSPAIAAAQDFSFGWNPRSGDVWVDSQLEDVNRYGTRYREPFVNEMTRYYGAPRDLVTELLGSRNWAPGDVYYACALAQVLGRPCRYVVDEWERDHGQGWGNLAQRLGIKPGSAEFHRLKRGFVPTYDRWARPIAIDDDLHRHFPNRARTLQARGNGASKLDSRGPGKADKPRGNAGQGHGNSGKANGHSGGDKGKGAASGAGRSGAKGASSGPGNKPGKGNPGGKGNGNQAGKGNGNGNGNGKG